MDNIAEITVTKEKYLKYQAQEKRLLEEDSSHSQASDENVDLQRPPTSARPATQKKTGE